MKPILIGLEMNEGGKKEDHVASLIHDGTVAVGAPDFAGELVFSGLGCWIVPLEVMVAVGKIDVIFMEDGCPLKGCSY